jgi:ribosomal protein S18 acetylase RimI-like enzyme
MPTTISERDRSRAVSTITLAFVLDPVVRWLYQDAADYLTYWPRFVEAYGGGAIASRAGHATEDFTGVALWLPPGISPDEDGVVELLHATAGSERRADVDAALEEMDVHHPTSAHYYLTLAGVDPLLQGRGIGSELLSAGLHRCDEQQLPAYLEATSSGSRDLYARHGFEELGVIQNGAMPPMWPMLREPARGT